MTTETILTDDQIENIAGINDHNSFSLRAHNDMKLARTIEKAVLQSPEVQALRKDAEAFRSMVSHRLTVKVDEVRSDVEVFRLGEWFAWPPARHYENDTELAAAARDAIHSTVAAMGQQ